MSIKIIFGLCILFSLPACSTISYYSQSIQGQISLLVQREEIQDLIDHPDTKSELKNTFTQALSIRQYASERLSLPDNDSYLQYVDTKQPYIVWNVFAAPALSLQPRYWCYPIVGCVSYRGYFAKADAEREAETLRNKNFDVHVGGVSAYSTLGWFDDPLLNTMLHWKERSLAGLIFHELSHQIIYIPDETNFNEAFASAVERLGTIQWLIEHYPEQLTSYLAYLNAQNDFRNLLLDTRDKLKSLYQTSQMHEIKLEKKELIIRGMKAQYFVLKEHWQEGTHFDSWFKQPINNARLTSTMTYLQDIPAFFAFFQAESGDWKAFYRVIIKLEKLSTEKRLAIIREKSKIDVDYNSLITLIKTNLVNIDVQ